MQVGERSVISTDQEPTAPLNQITGFGTMPEPLQDEAILKC